MKTTVTHLRNGKIRVEIIVYDELEQPVGLEFHPADADEQRYSNVRNAAPGDEGCFVLSENERSFACSAVLCGNLPDGVPGNSDPSAKRFHGWRGTTNGFATIAFGWRRVESDTPRKRGWGRVVVLSEDLRPGEPGA
jgi:hypothetical protein